VFTVRGKVLYRGVGLIKADNSKGTSKYTDALNSITNQINISHNLSSIVFIANLSHILFSNYNSQSNYFYIDFI